MCRRILPTAFDFQRFSNTSHPTPQIQSERAPLTGRPIRKTWITDFRIQPVSDQGECRRRVWDKSGQTEQTGLAGKPRTRIRGRI